jgi:GH25 family lysozyme M1 (1,4-beta-N-acetylmuramidase)/lysophospholipase L1-like esterase
MKISVKERRKMQGKKTGRELRSILFLIVLAVLLAGFLVIRPQARVDRLDGQGLDHDPRFDSVTKHYGIDVSSWQKTVDWQKAKSEGVEFAIIRVGNRAFNSGNIYSDKYAVENLVNAKKAGLKIGAYFYSQALNEAEASEEANWSVNFLRSNGITLDLPLCMDYEFGDNGSGRLAGANLNQDQMTANVISWLSAAQSGGFRGMLYANRSFLTNNVHHDQITNAGYLTWIARYGDYTGTSSHHYYSGNYNFWQYSSSTIVDFASGESRVDTDVWYDDGSRVNLNQDQPMGYFNGTLYKYQNGNIDWGYNGIQEYNGRQYVVENGVADVHSNGLRITSFGCYYVKDGYIDTSYTSLLYFAPTNTWLYVNHGLITFNDNTLVLYKGVWYKVTNSAVDWGFNGLQSYGGSQFWITNGRVNWGANGLMLYNNVWWYVANGIVNTSYNSLYYFAPVNTWYYIHDGYLHWNDNTLVLYRNTWFKVTNSAVDWGFNGLQSYGGAQFWVNNGMVNWGAGGLMLYNNVWWFVTNGIVNTSYNSLYYFAPVDTWYYIHDGYLHWNDNTLVFYNGAWFKVTNSAVQWNYTGAQKFNGLRWYVQNGMLNWGYTGLAYDPTNSGWYYIQNGVENRGYNSLVYFEPNRTWFYVHDGRLHWNDNTLAFYNGAWFKVTNSAVQWNYTGAQEYNGLRWYVQNGILNWGYTGLALDPTNNVWYYIQNGVENRGYNSLVYFAPNHTWFYVHDGYLHWNDNTMVSYNNTWYKVKDSRIDTSYTGVVLLNGVRVQATRGVVTSEYHSPVTNTSAITADTPIVIIGDSYSTGYAAGGQEFCWAGQLRDDFDLKNCVISSKDGTGLVRAIDGVNFQSLVDAAAGMTDPASVQYVIIMGGYNDNQYDTNTIINAGMNTVAEVHKQFPNARVLIGMPAVDHFRSDFRDRIQNQVLPAYKAVAENTGSIWMDGLRDTLADPDSISSDGIHPSVNGHHYLAIRVEHYLNQFCH